MVQEVSLIDKYIFLFVNLLSSHLKKARAKFGNFFEYILTVISFAIGI